MHLLIDNYDSFTYNIAQALGELGHAFEVVRNDKIDVTGVREMAPASIIVSPGPGRPEDAGISVEVVRAFADSVPVLGVCLGHQCIVTAFGGTIDRADTVMHGKVSQVYHDGRSIYEGMSNPFPATRYHSLTIAPESIPQVLDVTAGSTDAAWTSGRSRLGGPRSTRTEARASRMIAAMNASRAICFEPRRVTGFSLRLPHTHD